MTALPHVDPFGRQLPPRLAARRTDRLESERLAGLPATPEAEEAAFAALLDVVRDLGEGADGFRTSLRRALPLLRRVDPMGIPPECRPRWRRIVNFVANGSPKWFPEERVRAAATDVVGIALDVARRIDARPKGGRVASPHVR